MADRRRRRKPQGNEEDSDVGSDVSEEEQNGVRKALTVRAGGERRYGGGGEGGGLEMMAIRMKAGSGLPCGIILFVVYKAVPCRGCMCDTVRMALLLLCLDWPCRYGTAGLGIHDTATLSQCIR